MSEFCYDKKYQVHNKRYVYPIYFQSAGNIRAAVRLMRCISSGFMYANPYEASLVGVENAVTIRNSDWDSLENFALRYDLSPGHLIQINPDVSFDSDSKSSLVRVFSQVIVPYLIHEVTVNLPERRLYHFDAEKQILTIYPVAIGRDDGDDGDDQTPEMIAKITEMKENPKWTPTVQLRKKYINMGMWLPSVVYPGPDNPLGDAKMRLNQTKYLIHGTNEPSSIGFNSTGGCIRLENGHVRLLFSQLDLDDDVAIINQPVKYFRDESGIWIEAHPIYGEAKGLTGAEVMSLLDVTRRGGKALEDEIDRVLQKTTGIPTFIPMMHGT